jgi:hypothetical protein
LAGQKRVVCVKAKRVKLAEVKEKVHVELAAIEAINKLRKEV